MLYLLNLIEYLAGRDDLAVVSLKRYYLGVALVDMLFCNVDELPLIQFGYDQWPDVLETFS